MIQRPQFKAHLHVEVVKNEGVFLVSEIGYSALDGHLFELVAPLINGRRSAEEIAERLQAQATLAEVYYALTLLQQKGHLVESDQTLQSGEAALWSIQGIDPPTAIRRLGATAVSVTTFGKLAANPFLALLKSLHVRVDKEGELGIVLTDDYLRGELQAYNRDALRTCQPWLLFKPVGCEVWIGPVFKPGQTGCWECLAQRLRLNRTVETFVQRKQNRCEPFPIPGAVTPATQQTAYGMAATAIATWISRGEVPDLEGKVLSLNVLSWQTQFHTLVRQPLCPACGEASSELARPAEPLVLESRKKTFTEDGGHRVVAPEETLQKYECHVSHITGAVNALERHVVPNHGVMNVYLAGENFASQYRSLRHLKKTVRSRSSGKGITDVQARASGLCEALERYSGVFQGTEMRRKATLKELDGLGIHPNDCMHCSERQYMERNAINAQGSRFYHVPQPFDEKAEIEWTPVWSLTYKVHRYLPTEYCYYAYPSPESEWYCIGCSNGNAAGNTLEEAVLQGFLELVERDCVAMWWYNRVRRPGVDLESFDEPFLSNLRAFLGGRHRELWVLDLTNDLGIPVFAALSRHTGHPQEQITMGFGAHLDPRIALLRAMTELTQSLVWVLHQDNDVNKTSEIVADSDILTWFKTATLANQPYLLPDENSQPRTTGAYTRCWTDDLRDDVLLCQSLVERHGMEMLVLDQTRPDIGLPVVKVFVPGLRHFWPRFAPGRLYEVPVALGWRSSPLTEEQLNPIPMFL